MSYVAKSDFLHVMQSRGFLADCTDLQALDAALVTPGQTAYIGYDATAPSLHVGHQMNIMVLRWFQQTGHRPITLMGGGTTKVGDPSFRSDERPLLDAAAIDANIARIKQAFAAFVDYDSALMLNNAEWLDDLKYLDFLRDIGRHFSVNRMLSFESVKSRLDREQSLSFLEFNYMILQAYDFMELNRRHGCLLQMGGSDQWGNIVNGIDLTRRVRETEVYGLTTPLLTTSDGRKMGKSQGGAVWLNADMLSPYEYWQFWRNTTDADVGRFLKLFTELPLDECDRSWALCKGLRSMRPKRASLDRRRPRHFCMASDAADGRRRPPPARSLKKAVMGEDLAHAGTLSDAPILAMASALPSFSSASGLAKSGKDAKAPDHRRRGAAG